MKNFKYIFRLTLTLFLITAVVAGLLGLVNYITKDKIRQLQEEKSEKAMQEVLPADTYEKISDSDGAVNAAYKADDKGYVVDVTVNGFGGAIQMMVGIDTEGKVTGVSIVSHAETASLGANATRGDFRSQYVGKDSRLAVTKDGGDIDALTGATVTSRAVTEGVNLALEFVKGVEK